MGTKGVLPLVPPWLCFVLRSRTCTVGKLPVDPGYFKVDLLVGVVIHHLIRSPIGDRVVDDVCTKHIGCLQRPVRHSFFLAGYVQESSLLFVDQVQLLLDTFDVSLDNPSCYLGVTTSDQAVNSLVLRYHSFVLPDGRGWHLLGCLHID